MAQLKIEESCGIHGTVVDKTILLFSVLSLD